MKKKLYSPSVGKPSLSPAPLISAFISLLKGGGFLPQEVPFASPFPFGRAELSGERRGRRGEGGDKNPITEWEDRDLCWLDPKALLVVDGGSGKAVWEIASTSASRFGRSEMCALAKNAFFGKFCQKFWLRICISRREIRMGILFQIFIKCYFFLRNFLLVCREKNLFFVLLSRLIPPNLKRGVSVFKGGSSLWLSHVLDRKRKWKKNFGISPQTHVEKNTSASCIFGYITFTWALLFKKPF